MSVERYAELAREIEALLAGERDPIANAANCAAQIFHGLPDLSWVGFYFLRETPDADADAELVLGPFQGRSACVRIALGRGVCGTAAARRETQMVADVTAFEGHIACDPEARSELVVPLVREGELYGVLDLDSAQPARFTPVDRDGVERLAEIYLASLG